MAALLAIPEADAGALVWFLAAITKPASQDETQRHQFTVYAEMFPDGSGSRAACLYCREISGAPLGRVEC
jgi:hypothetical protein